METQHPYDRPPPRRRPLQDSTFRANNAQNCPQLNTVDAYAPPKAPQHSPQDENVKPRVYNDLRSPLSNMQDANSTIPADGSGSIPDRIHINPQLQAVANSYRQESNRDSQISTVSNTSNKSRRKTHVGPWRLGRTLGRGSSGRVRLARHEITGQYAAVKIVSKSNPGIPLSSSITIRLDKEPPLNDGDRRLPFGIEREVVIMKLIEHPNVLRLYDVWENRGELYLVLEFVEGGELFNYIVKRGRLPEHEAVEYFRQILSGLSYCHRFNICHRDLKPENLLLNKEHNTIKIADFGMAAMQPAGSLLSTFCGSPHYASPEILQAKSYSGDKTDIWSCGIILFVLLCGRLPFDEESVHYLRQKVIEGRYMMPTGLSEEAKDLIFRMLQKDPEVRIDMDQIWDHPLMHKYEVVGGSANGRRLNMDRWGGAPPPPTPEQVGRPVRRRRHIDGEILRNLRTLWHGEDEETIIERLLSKEPNQEKVFYCLLMKYRNDHLENYQGHGLEHSASDYHHKPPPPRKISTRQLHSQGRGHARNRSQFSILSEDDARARESYYQDPVASETVESYDPFRPSLNPITDAKAEYANVTVLRGQPSTPSRQRPSGVRHPVASRVTALQHGHRVGSIVSITSSGGHSKRRISTKQYGSRGSLANSSHRGSSPIVIRPSDHHKRNISFSRFSKNPAASPVRGRQGKVQTLVSPGNEYVAEGSPAPDVVPIPKAPQKKSSNAVPTPGEGGRRTVSHLWREEARQVSNELERFCDEVFNRDEMFNRSSITSSAHTGNTSRLTLANEPSPVSSFTSREEPSSVTPKATRTRDRADLEARPLPTVPPRITVDGKGNTGYQNHAIGNQHQHLAEPGPNVYLEDVIAHLDKLIQPGGPPQVGRDGRRTVSATPDCRSPDGSEHLPAISEEGRYSDADELQILLNQGHTGCRSASAPLRDGPYMRGGSGGISTKSSAPATRNGRSTIRMVHHESPGPDPVEPLNIHKKAALCPYIDVRARQGAPTTTRQSITEPEVYKPNLVQGLVHLPGGGTNNSDNRAARDNGNPRKPGSRTESGEGRMKGWFRRGVSNDDGEIRPLPPPKDTWPLPPMFDKETPKAKVPVTEKQVAPEFEKRYPHNHNPSWGGTKGFFKMFRRGLRKQSAEMAFGDEFDDTASTGTSANGDDRQLGLNLGFNGNQGTQPLQQNWFARIFHIKPASKIVCFSVNKRKARKEIVTILRDWKRYGMRNVVVDKVHNVVHGRVDAANFLRIKEVSFVVDIMTVVDHSQQRSQLSMARFMQEKGAASSLNRVVDTLETVLEGKGVLVKDEKKRRLMVKMLS